uniref:Putative basic polymerase 2 n=1 Tax=Pilchard orthomyxovirus TaxID=2732827 RepID=A0A6M4AK27_9ORTO|nr:putative basic polymerase 2 [Pilchard orthomyxovirus]
MFSSSIVDTTTLGDLKSAKTFDLTKVESRSGLQVRRALNHPKTSRWRNLQEKLRKMESETPEEKKEKMKELKDCLRYVKVTKVKRKNGSIGTMLIKHTTGLKEHMATIETKVIGDLLLIGQDVPSKYKSMEEDWKRAKTLVGFAKGSEKVDVARKLVNGSAVRGWGLQEQSGPGKIFCNTMEIVTATTVGKEEAEMSGGVMETHRLRKDLQRLIIMAKNNVEEKGEASMSVRSEGGGELEDDILTSAFNSVMVSKDQMKVALNEVLSTHSFQGVRMINLVRAKDVFALQPGPFMEALMLLDGIPIMDVNTTALNNQLITFSNSGYYRRVVRDPLDHYSNGYSYRLSKGKETIGFFNKRECVIATVDTGRLLEIKTNSINWVKMTIEMLVKAKACPIFHTVTQVVAPTLRKLYERATEQANETASFIGETLNRDGGRMDVEGTIGNRGMVFMSEEEAGEWFSKIPPTVAIRDGKLKIGQNDSVSLNVRGELEVVVEEGGTVDPKQAFFEGMLIVNAKLPIIIRMIREQFGEGIYSGNLKGFGIPPMEKCVGAMQGQLISTARRQAVNMIKRLEDHRVERINLVKICRLCFGFSDNVPGPNQMVIHVIGSNFQFNVLEDRNMTMINGTLFCRWGKSKAGEVQFTVDSSLSGSSLGSFNIIGVANSQNRRDYPFLSGDELVLENTIGLMEIGGKIMLVEAKSRGKRLALDWGFQENAVYDAVKVAEDNVNEGFGF